MRPVRQDASLKDLSIDFDSYVAAGTKGQTHKIEVLTSEQLGSVGDGKIGELTQVFGLKEGSVSRPMGDILNRLMPVNNIRDGYAFVINLCSKRLMSFAEADGSDKEKYLKFLTKTSEILVENDGKDIRNRVRKQLEDARMSDMISDGVREALNEVELYLKRLAMEALNKANA